MYKVKSSWNKDSERTKQRKYGQLPLLWVGETPSEKDGSSWKRCGTGLQVQLCVCGGGGGWLSVALRPQKP